LIFRKDICTYTPYYFDLDSYKRLWGYNWALGLPSIVIDGRFNGFPDLEDMGWNDNMQNYASKMEYIHYTKMQPCYEEEKLTKAFYIAHKLGYKWMILLGADEYLEGDINHFMMKLKAVSTDEGEIFKMRVKEHNPGHKYDQRLPIMAKIFHNLDQLEAKNLHWLVYKKGNRWALKSKPNVIEGLVIHQDSKIRDRERDAMMEKYQDWNIPREKLIFRDKVSMYKNF